jgi:hypothetical protein
LASYLALREVPDRLPRRGGKKISWQVLLRWVHQGRLPAVRIAGRYYIHPADVEALAEPVAVPPRRPRVATSAAQRKQDEWTRRILAEAGLA